MNQSNSWDIFTYLNEELKKSNSNYELLLSQLVVKYSKTDVIEAFKYILKENDNAAFIDKTIRFIHKRRYIDSLPFLIDFILKNTNDSKILNLKVLAIKTISNFKDTSAVPSLLYCLNDKNSNYKIRLAAADALGRIGDKNAFEALGNIICDEKEKSTYVKESAVVALGNLGDNRALDVFDSIMSSKQMILEKFSFLKERVIEAISKFDISRNKKALQILKNSLLEKSPQVRINAIEALMNSNIDGVYNLIYERLKFDDDIEVRKNALIALYNISDRKILDEVIDGDFDCKLKECAKKIIDEYEGYDE